MFCSAVRDTRFPRSQALQDLLDIIKKHPTFGKDAGTALVTIAEAIRDNASQEEIAILIKSTVSQEAYVRNASLQCLQVRVMVRYNAIFNKSPFPILLRCWI